MYQLGTERISLPSPKPTLLLDKSGGSRRVRYHAWYHMLDKLSGHESLVPSRTRPFTQHLCWPSPAGVKTWGQVGQAVSITRPAKPKAQEEWEPRQTWIQTEDPPVQPVRFSRVSAKLVKLEPNTQPSRCLILQQVIASRHPIQHWDLLTITVYMYTTTNKRLNLKLLPLIDYITTSGVMRCSWYRPGGCQSWPTAIYILYYLWCDEVQLV